MGILYYQVGMCYLLILLYRLLNPGKKILKERGEVIMEIFRNIKRRKCRSLITIVAITVGIFVLMVMGSLAESLNLTIMNMNKHFAEKVMITEQGAHPVMGLMTECQIAKLFDHQDVAAVVPMLLAIYDDDVGTFNIRGGLR